MSKIKKIITWILKIFGYEIRSLPGRRHELCKPFRYTMEESLRHILSLSYYPKIIIDVGVANGTSALLNVFPNSRFLWVEPVKEFENAILKLQKKYNGQFIIAAAGKTAGTATFSVEKEFLYGSSFFLGYTGGTILSREIDVIRLDDLIETYNLKNDILLKIDTQGYELEVLEGAQKLLQNCEVIILETEFFKFHQNYPEFYDIVDYMKKNNFVVYDIVDGHNRALDGALAQKDVLFVKENGRFRTSHQWGTQEQMKEFLNINKRCRERF